MDMAEELSGTFKVPKALIAFLAIVVGILILFFPYILNVLIAFFLVAWGLLKAAELGSKPRSPNTPASPALTANPFAYEESDSSEDHA
jgi:hypothetical protein